MGEVQVPDGARYGASTQRAVQNFPISSVRFPRSFLRALGTVKFAAAKANGDLRLLPEPTAQAIMTAAREVIAGTHDDQFVVDIFQTGSGTSTNMNANEVIAHRARELLRAAGNSAVRVHPNDDVNRCQSSNDVIPTAIHIAAVTAVRSLLIPALETLAASFDKKAGAFQETVKAGRTHLRDATPISLGQEFSGYTTQIRYGVDRLTTALPRLCELALGGTAVGTGLNAHPQFATRAIAAINDITGYSFREASNHFEAQGAQDALVELSGQLRTVAGSLMKISNDLRWLSSGPRCGFGEILLPEVQPGSSIMPAKANPVILESMRMICCQVMGNDSAIMIAGQHGEFELNVMLPLMAHAVLQSIEILAAGCRNVATRCVDGIEADTARCREYAERTLATCTALVPRLGYDTVAAVAKRSLKENRPLRDVVLKEGLLSEAELGRLLDLREMAGFR